MSLLNLEGFYRHTRRISSNLPFHILWSVSWQLASSIYRQIVRPVEPRERESESFYVLSGRRGCGRSQVAIELAAIPLRTNGQAEGGSYIIARFEISRGTIGSSKLS